MYEIHSQSIAEIAKALCKAQSQFESAKKTSQNPHFRSKYADLSAVWDALRDILPEHGLSVIQTILPNEIGTAQMLVTTLLHSSGEWFKSYAPLLIDKNNSQAIGSALSYMRRYSLAAICGITQADDDGNDATFISRKQLFDLTESMRGMPDVVEKVMKTLKSKGIESFDKITIDLLPKVQEFISSIKNKKASNENPEPSPE